jgi:hypothetical protein
MMSSERIWLRKEKVLPPQRIGPSFEEVEQNRGDKKGREEPEQELDDLPSGKEAEPSSAPCQETTLSLFPKR